MTQVSKEVICYTCGKIVVKNYSGEEYGVLWAHWKSEERRRLCRNCYTTVEKFLEGFRPKG